jgi:hypothetical protein
MKQNYYLSAASLKQKLPLAHHGHVCVFKLLLQHKLDLSYSGIFHSVNWWLDTNVSRNPIGPIFKGQAVLDLEYENYRFYLPTSRAASVV